DAAQRGEVTALTALLENVDRWRGFRPAPPAFVLGAVEAVALAQPGNPVWRRVLPRWLNVWDRANLGPSGANLAAVAGTLGGPGEAPPGVAAEAWFLHQAARAVQRNDARNALACIEKAQQTVPESELFPESAIVAAALPRLLRLAKSQALGQCLGS